MTKFEIDDRVRVTHTIPAWQQAEDWAGQEATVTQVDPADDELQYRIERASGRVIWASEAQLELLDGLRMVRCVSDGCQSSHALPPGSAWACSDHSNHIATGGTR